MLKTDLVQYICNYLTVTSFLIIKSISFKYQPKIPLPRVLSESKYNMYSLLDT